MPDYDVEATGLASPPAVAVLTSYRPAVAVRNNGIHPADVTGTIRRYRRLPPGELLDTWPISYSALAAGASAAIQAAAYWTPTVADIGIEYLFTADVNTDDDQVEKNNHLSPITVLVTGGPTPTPPEVPVHADQHEEGGADPINVTGLAGQLADPQTPFNHASNHQPGGSDVLNVAGLFGELTDPQPPKNHAADHELGGTDELNVDSLPGHLADEQTPEIHGSISHHNGIPSPIIPGFTPAIGTSALAVTQAHQHAGPGTLSTITTPIIITTTPEYVASIIIPPGKAAAGTQFHLMATGLITCAAPAPPGVFKFYLGAQILQIAPVLLGGIVAQPFRIEGDFILRAAGAAGKATAAAWLLLNNGGATPAYYVAAPGDEVDVDTTGITICGIVFDWVAPTPGESLIVHLNEVRLSKL